MRVLRFFILITTVFFSQLSLAQDKEKNPRILLLVDGSSSMMKDWTAGNIRFEAAAKIIDKLIDSVYSVNPNVEFALRVYGHEHPTSENNCYDTKLEVMFSKDNYTQMLLRMAALRPLGVSPIAYSLQQAAEYDMKNLKENKYSLILITDGGESCDGDICTVAEELLRKKIDFKPYILSLVDYAPLKSQYDCLGDYLLVTGPDKIDPVVGKIVESYRKSFIQPTATVKLIETVKAAPPSALKVKTPEYSLPVVKEDPKPSPEPVVKKEEPKPVVNTPPPPPVKTSKIQVYDATTPRPKENVTTLTPSDGAKPLPQRYASRSFSTKEVKEYTPPTPEVEKRAAEPVYKPMPTATLKENNVPPPTQPKIDPATIEVTVKREETKETTLLVYLWDGKGKYYETAPEIVLLDPKTNKPVHKFVRTVDAYGQPRPQTVPGGRYNVMFTKKEGLMFEIVVDPNRETTVKLPVPRSSLYFYYEGNPNRPVKEFAARVNQFMARRQVTKQYCTETLLYEPETYHLAVNTNPVIERYVDIGVGENVGIAIEEPGKVVVNNPNGYRNVQYYYQHGDRYDNFIPLNITGDMLIREFLIQPGRYKVAYVTTPHIPNSKPVVKPFIIKSNVITEITLD